DRPRARRRSRRPTPRRAVARPGPEDRRRRVRGADADQRGRSRRPPRRAACTADGGARRPVVRARERRAPPDARHGGRGRHRPARRRLPRMTLAFLNLSWPVFADALALGSIYALMAVGIGLVFGVLRLVNFAYGQLMMASAFALAYGSQWGLANWESILFCIGVVLALSLVMDRLVFRPLPGHSPAVMLVATFAVAFILQNIALI